MKNVDVLFLYETKVRELENICLIKNELERRGITVGVSNTWNEYGKKKHPYRARVVVTHAMNHDGIYEFVCDCCGNAPKIVNMQCEQIGTVGDAKRGNSRFVLRGVAHQAMNVCWGKKTFERLRELSGIDEKHVCITGNIAHDFCRKELRNYYDDRKTLFKKYNIEGQYKVNLFISSFAYVNLPEEVKNQSEISNKDAFIEYSVNSLNNMMIWFRRLLDETDDQMIIYRPHPAEADNEQLKALEEKYCGRFRVISELSVKQWCIVSDKVFTWYSTAAAEAYMLGVPCGILRPIPMIEDLELEIFSGAEFIDTYEAFLESVNGDIANGLNAELLAEYFHYDGGMAYVALADLIEKVLNDDEYTIEYNRKVQNKSVAQSLKSGIYKAVSSVADILPQNMPVFKKYRTVSISDKYTSSHQNNNNASQEEIAAIQSKIRNALLSI